LPCRSKLELPQYKLVQVHLHILADFPVWPPTSKTTRNFQIFLNNKLFYDIRRYFTFYYILIGGNFIFSIFIETSERSGLPIRIILGASDSVWGFDAGSIVVVMIKTQPIAIWWIKNQKYVIIKFLSFDFVSAIVILFLTT
jgi:hypothetical protein